MQYCLRFTLLLLFAAITFPSCKNNNTPQTETVPTGIVTKGNWYKRYTGTIAGQPVVVNMYCNTLQNRVGMQDACAGSYYYVNKSELLDLSITNDSTVNNLLHITESVGTERYGMDAEKKDNSWKLTINGTHATGKFLNAQTGKEYDIELQEDYTEACKLNVVSYADSFVLKTSKWTAVANASYVGIEPAENNTDEANFLDKVLLASTGDDSGRIKTIRDFPKKNFSLFYKSYLASMEDLEIDTAGNEKMSDFTDDLTLLPVYNSRNILATGKTYYSYTGGAHGNYATYYTNADLKNKKILHLSDIIQVDSAAISKLLNQQAHESFKIAPKEPLTTFLFTESVPATDNFFIGDNGLTFSYAPYEIACYAAGEIKLFLSYSKLKPLIKPEFVSRMGLKL